MGEIKKWLLAAGLGAKLSNPEALANEPPTPEAVTMIKNNSHTVDDLNDPKKTFEDNAVPAVTMVFKLDKKDLPRGADDLDTEGDPYGLDLHYYYYQSEPRHKDLQTITGHNSDVKGTPIKIRLRAKTLDAFLQFKKHYDADLPKGVDPLDLTSGFRTLAEQAKLKAKLDKEHPLQPGPYGRPRSYAGPPGTSEHHLGNTIDFRGIRQITDFIHFMGFDKPSQPGDIPAPFLAGFIPTVINEPWHWRYVGTEAAIEYYQTHKGELLDTKHGLLARLVPDDVTKQIAIFNWDGKTYSITFDTGTKVVKSIVVTES